MATVVERGMLFVREMFATLQGEGSRAGSPAVFIRFTGCNLWSGRNEDRSTGRGECARWCDTDFFGGDRMTPEQIVERALIVKGDMRAPLAVLTGGEPMLQLGRSDLEGVALVNLLHVAGFEVAIETNGTVRIDDNLALDHITVSPKPLMHAPVPRLDHVLQVTGDDLKVIVPTPFAEDALAEFGDGFRNQYVQPMDRGDRGFAALPEAIKVAGRLGWRVSVQTHKHLGLP